MRYSGKVERQLDRIPDVRYPEKVERRPGRNSGCDMSGWNVDGEEFRMRYVQVECRREEFRMRYVRVECRGEKNSGCEIPGRKWDVGRTEFRM